MPYTLPRTFPALRTLAGDVAPTAPELARWLGVSERSAQRWLADDAAPRPVMAALWLASRWGMSDLDAHRQHLAQTAGALVAALQAEIARLRADVERLAPLARAGAANEPLRPSGTPGALAHGHGRQGRDDGADAGRVQLHRAAAGLQQLADLAGQHRHTGPG